METPLRFSEKSIYIFILFRNVWYAMAWHQWLVCKVKPPQEKADVSWLRKSTHVRANRDSQMCFLYSSSVQSYIYKLYQMYLVFVPTVLCSNKKTAASTPYLQATFGGTAKNQFSTWKSAVYRFSEYLTMATIGSHAWWLGPSARNFQNDLVCTAQL